MQRFLAARCAAKDGAHEQMLMWKTTAEGMRVERLGYRPSSPLALTLGSPGALEFSTGDGTTNTNTTRRSGASGGGGRARRARSATPTGASTRGRHSASPASSAGSPSPTKGASRAFRAAKQVRTPAPPIETSPHPPPPLSHARVD